MLEKIKLDEFIGKLVKNVETILGKDHEYLRQCWEDINDEAKISDKIIFISSLETKWHHTDKESLVKLRNTLGTLNSIVTKNKEVFNFLADKLELFNKDSTTQQRDELLEHSSKFAQSKINNSLSHLKRQEFAIKRHGDEHHGKRYLNGQGVGRSGHI